MYAHLCLRKCISSNKRNSYVTFSFLLSFFFFLQYWGLNSGSHLARQLLYHLSPSASYFVLIVYEMGSPNYVPRLALNLNPPDLCLHK
jgi:hypothetical protein